MLNEWTEIHVVSSDSFGTAEELSEVSFVTFHNLSKTSDEHDQAEHTWLVERVNFTIGF
jgi:hypothetical protein